MKHKVKLLLTLVFTVILCTTMAVILSACSGTPGEKGESGADGKDGVSIVSVEKTESEGLTDTYTITYSDGKTTTFTVTNGKDGVDGADGEPGKDGQDGEKGETGEQGPVGPAGEDGIDGKSITDIQLSGDKQYLLFYSDAEVISRIDVTFFKGEKGDTGEKGEAGTDGKDGKDGQDAPKITGIVYESGELVFSFSDDSSPISVEIPVPENGKDGKDGVGIESIDFADGKLQVLYTDKSTDEIVIPVIQGPKGDKGDPGTPGSVVTIGENGNWFIDGEDTGVKAKGEDGQNGADGKASTITISEKNTWVIDGKDTGVSVNGGKGDPGEDGQDGEDGATWLTGTNKPEDNLGKTGDFYFNSTTYDIYVKGESSWTFICNIKGADGLPGSDGEDGISISKIAVDGEYVVFYSDTNAEISRILIGDIFKTKTTEIKDTLENYTVTQAGDGDLYGIIERKEPIPADRIKTSWGFKSLIDEIKRENFCYDFYIAKTEDTPSTDFVFITDGGLVDSFYLFFTDDTGTVFRAYRLKFYVNHWYNFSIQDKNSTEISTFQKEEGTSVEITRNEFPHADIPGYTFSHWFVTVNNDTGEETFEISQGESFVVKGNCTFEPVYTPNENTLRFDKNDDEATGEMEPVQMKTGEERNLPAVGFEKTGYHLKGWATSSDGEVVYADESSFTMGTESECTLYAVWEANTNTLYFDKNDDGATGEMEPVQMQTGEERNLPAVSFVKTGYHLKGWATNAGGGVVYADEGSYAMGTDSEYTLYAVWEITTYSIAYNIDGGTWEQGSNPSTFTIEDFPVNLTFEPVIKNDYAFMGWYNEKNVSDEAFMEYTISEVGDITFCAKLLAGTEGLQYVEENGGYTVRQYSGSETEIVIPDFHADKPVLSIQGQNYSNPVFVNGINSITFGINTQLTSIGYSAFYGCSSLTSIEIPSSVTSIAGSAFFGCSSLTSIEIPSSVTSISGDAFYGCSGLTSIEIPSGVTSIGNQAFDGCSSLTSVVFGENSQLTSIGGSAFSGCSSLTSVVFGENSQLTSIGDNTFSGCSSLTSIEIPSSVTSISNSAFANCSGLESIIVEEGNTVYISEKDCLIEIANSTLILGCKNSIIPDYVTSIGDYAFSGCRGLTSIEIPSSVVSIGGYAFRDCSSLTSIEIPSGVTSIGDYAFSGCRGLTSIEIPGGVTSIGQSAFSGCSSLTHIEIPSGVTSIDWYAFRDCSSLTSIKIPSGVTSIGYSAFDGCRGLDIVYYGGASQSDWDDIEIGGYNTYLTSATLYYYSEEQPITTGNYWHYVNGIPSKWEWGEVKTFHFETNGGNEIKDVIAAALTELPIPVQEGHTFIGWYDNAELEGTPIELPYYNAEKTYLYAKWEKEKRIRFETNCEETLESVWTIHGELTTLPIIVRDGYYLVWYDNAEFTGNPIYAPYSPLSDITLYAKWVEIDGNQSAGLEIENGMIVGIGSCTDTELILNMPIAEGAFIGCITITKVTFGEGVTSIGRQAFGNSGTGCRNLKEVVFISAVPPEIGSDVFGTTWNASDFRVYVPAEGLEAYESVDAEYWQKNLVGNGKLQGI